MAGKPYTRERLVEAFWKKVAKQPGGCWLWTGSTDGKYGVVRVTGRLLKAHRFAYELDVAPIPPGHELHHLPTCSFLCVNPAHLTPLTRPEHRRIHPESRLKATAAAAERQKARTHCLNGHLLEGENVYVRSNGSRYCKACRRVNARVQ